MRGCQSCPHSMALSQVIRDRSFVVAHRLGTLIPLVRITRDLALRRSSRYDRPVEISNGDNPAKWHLILRGDCAFHGSSCAHNVTGQRLPGCGAKM